MAMWTEQEAQEYLDELLDLVEKGAPQSITRDGTKPIVYVLRKDDWLQMTGQANPTAAISSKITDGKTALHELTPISRPSGRSAKKGLGKIGGSSGL